MAHESTHWNAKSLSRLFLVLLVVLSFFLTNRGIADVAPSYSIVAGEAGITISGGSRVINQTTDRLIIDWDSFSIAEGAVTQFNQPGSSSAALNRVTGGSPSLINGLLRANGRVFLLNPNGIVISSTGQIDVGGFVASTLDVSNEEFLAGGDLNFLGDSEATIVNMGTIGASHGDVFLIAAQVTNTGNISAGGTVGLAAGTDVLLKESGTERIFVRGSSGTTKSDGVVNTGTINANVAELKAHGGNIYAMAVRNEGTVRATGVSREGGQLFLRAGNRGSARGSGSSRISSTGTLRATRVIGKGATEEGGTIVVDSGETGTTDIGGTVDAASSDKNGGEIFLLGETINIEEDSLIIANGQEQGGRIFVGRPTADQTVEFSGANSITVGNNAQFDVSAGLDGDAGQAVIIANQDLTFNGFVLATGGYSSGDGGEVELSGKETLSIPLLVDAVDIGASNGNAGTLFLDPSDILISTAPGGLITGTPTTISSLNATDVANFLNTVGNLTVQTDLGSTGTPGETGNITLDTGIGWNSGNSLILNAANEIIFELGADVSATGGGNITLRGQNGIRMGDLTGASSGSTSTPSVRLLTTSGDIVMSNLDSGDSTGIALANVRIQTDTGDVDIQGYSAAGIGAFISESTIRSINGGNISIEGRATGTTDADGVRIENVSSIVSPGFPSVAPFFAIPPNGDVSVTGNASIKILGQASGTGRSVHIIDNPATSSISQNVIGGDGTQDVEIISAGGDAELDSVAADEFMFSRTSGASGGLTLRDAVIDWVTVNSADHVDITSPGAIRVRSISSTGDVSIDTASGTFATIGPIRSGTEIKIKGSDGSAGTFDLFGTLSAPSITIDGGLAGADVETRGTLDLNGYSFRNIGEVRGVSGTVGDTLIDSNADSTIEIFQDPFDSANERIGAFIRGTQFYGYETVSGGGGNDTFTIGSQGAFTDTETTLSGGAGNDLFLFLNQATVAGVSGDGGFDTLRIDDRLLGGTNTYTISEGRVSRNPQYLFNGIDGLQLFLGAGNDTVNTDAYSFAQRFDGGAGFDTLNVGNRAFLPLSPALLGGRLFLHENFESPVTAAPTTGAPLITTVINNTPLPGGESGLDFSTTTTYAGGPGGTANVMPGGVGTFGAAAAAGPVVGQAVVLQINGEQFLLQAPTSLDGTFTFAPIESMIRLRENLNPEAWRELAASIEYDGPMVLVMDDGPVAVALDGGNPPADALNDLQSNLLAEAAQELAAALELFVGLPVTELDGVVSISAVPVVPDPAVVNALLEGLGDAAFTDLADALDEP